MSLHHGDYREERLLRSVNFLEPERTVTELSSLANHSLVLVWVHPSLPASSA